MINYCARSNNFVILPLFLNTVLVLLFTANSHINNSAGNSFPKQYLNVQISLSHAVNFTIGSPFFFLSAPSVLWPSETGGELTPSVLEAWGSDALLEGWEGACSWYNRFLSFSSKVLMVRSTNSTLRGPSLSDSPGPPLTGCWWLDD